MVWLDSLVVSMSNLIIERLEVRIRATPLKVTTLSTLFTHQFVGPAN